MNPQEPCAKYVFLRIEMVGFLSNHDPLGYVGSASVKMRDTADAILVMLRKMLNHHGDTIVALYEILKVELSQTEKDAIKKWNEKFYTTHKLASMVQNNAFSSSARDEVY